MLYFFFLIFWHAPILHLLGCRTTGISFLFNSFLSTLHFSNLICQPKSGQESRFIFINIIIKTNISKIHIKNTRFIIIKYGITRISIKAEYISVCLKNTKKFFNHFAGNKAVGNKFQSSYRIINSFITHFFIYIFITAIYYQKKGLQKQLYYTCLEIYTNKE